MRWLHIYSAAPALLLMVFFAVTGLYLNHPGANEGNVVNSQQELSLPPWALGDWQDNGPPAAIVRELLQWLAREHGISGIDFSVEYDDLDELLIIDLAGPDGSTLVEIFFAEARVAVDRRQLSTLATLNNLHRAKHVSTSWRYLSDFSAICMLVFCVTGFWLITVNRMERRRASIVVVAGCSLFLFTVVVLH